MSRPFFSAKTLHGKHKKSDGTDQFYPQVCVGHVEVIKGKMHGKGREQEQQDRKGHAEHLLFPDAELGRYPGANLRNGGLYEQEKEHDRHDGRHKEEYAKGMCRDAAGGSPDKPIQRRKIDKDEDDHMGVVLCLYVRAQT
ncbi:hypothetical protein [Desulfoluna spongiiphila]|uniref:hypothetical protein n=1 Tax=Desulfoluna spongiiphila TaxID=419481 RepID=UPI0011146BCA|nr:hypothetical protein [Desulfoluna spongiiphila]